MNTPPPPFTAPPESPSRQRRRRRRTRRVIIGRENGSWYEYRADIATPIHCQRLAHITPQTRQDAPPMSDDVAGAFIVPLAGVFGGTLTLLLLAMELVRRLM